jgi:hypothetical protein
MIANNKGGKERLNAIKTPSGKFISLGYAEYFARMIVHRNNSPIKKKSKIISTLAG